MKPDEINTRRFVAIAVQGLVATIVASGLVTLFISSGDTLEQLRNNLRWPLVPLLALPVLISWTCNGLRFHLMARCIGKSIGFRRAWSIAVSSEFGIAASPGGVGGTAVRLGFLKKCGLSFVDGVSLLAADIFLDILFFACIAPFALHALLRYFSTGESWFDCSMNPAWLLLVPIPLGAYASRRRIMRTLKKHPSFLKHRMAARLRLVRRMAFKGFLDGKAATTRIFKNHHHVLLLNFMLTAMQFTARYSVLPLAIWMLDVPLNPLPLIVVQGVLFMVSMLVVAPGGGGSVEILAAIALPQFMPLHLVGIAILLWRIFTYHAYLLIGGAVFARTFRQLMR